jgi:4-hydroxy-tetrahydrodipicolinate synthase
MNTNFEGTGVALITPFKDDLSVDFDALERIINHAISGGIDYLAALGTTGEPATLTKQEKKDIITFCKEKIDGRVPLIVGIGGNNTSQVIEDLKDLDTSGVSGILSIAPYYNKPTQRGLYAHFKAISDVSDLPIIIYNVPSRTGSNIEAETAIALAKDCAKIVALKEASGNFSQIMQIIKNKPNDFLVISGDDALTLPMISLGCKGVISVIANSHPFDYSQLVKAALNSDFTKANKYHFKLLDYIDALFEEGSPSGIKAALKIMGICQNNVRLPLVSVSDKHYLNLQKLLSSIE